MEFIENSYWWKSLVLDCPPGADNLTARVRVRQPQGYVQELTVEEVEVRDGKARVPILYPLVDDGRHDPRPGLWEDSWLMGEYRFDVQLMAEGRVIVSGSTILDPHGFFPSDRMVIAVDARPQIIECAPRQALFLDEDEARFLYRIRRRRVSRCEVEADVTSREGSAPLAGPWRLSLTHELQEHSFSIAGWGPGEYWIRLRPLVGGEPVGPWCVRKFWKQAGAGPPPPEVLELAGYPEVLVDDYSFEEAEGVQFVPDTMDKNPAPLAATTEPHDEEMLGLESVTWNEEAGRYEAVYRNGGGRIEREDTREERSRLRMLLVSEDGESWEKPALGLVEYDGSTANNILSDDRDPTPAERQRAHALEHAEFRFYDAGRDGPVDIDHVFIASAKEDFPSRCRSLENQDGEGGESGAFRPRKGEFWPFEQRGDLYLVLTREPVLYLGVGMDLMHTSETIRCHVEESDGKRLHFYFRPASPAYPSHGATYDNMHLGATADAYHLVAPDESGDGPVRAIRMALQDAGLRPQEVDYVNAHGTSTPLNDAAETRAIKTALGEDAYHIPVSATKSMIGHVFGAAGALESIAAIRGIETGRIHPTINLESPDPECDLDYVPDGGRQADLNVVLKNSFGFGGQNACLVLRRYPPPA